MIKNLGMLFLFFVSTQASATSFVGIGTASPTALLTVAGTWTNGTTAQAAIGGTGNSGALSFLRTSDGSAQARMGWGSSTENSEFRTWVGGGGSYYTVYTAGAEHFRIDSNGNVGIGTTAPTTRLDVTGPMNEALYVRNSLVPNTYLYSGVATDYGRIGAWNSSSAASRPLVLQDAGGNVGIGTTAPGAKLEVNSGAFGAATGINISTTTAGANTYEQYKANGAVIGSISSAAGVNVAFNTTSDIRLKGGFKPVLSPLKQLNEIEVTNFYYLADPTHQRMDGFKAQQLYTVAPYAVTKPEKDVDENGKLVPWLADYSKIVPLVTAAVQELYREVFGLKGDVATLKAQNTAQSRDIASVNAKTDSKADKTEVDAQLKTKDLQIQKLEQENAAIKAKAEQDNAAMKARLDKIEKMLNSK